MTDQPTPRQVPRQAADAIAWLRAYGRDVWANAIESALTARDTAHAAELAAMREALETERRRISDRVTGFAYRADVIYRGSHIEEELSRCLPALDSALASPDRGRLMLDVVKAARVGRDELISCMAIIDVMLTVLPEFKLTTKGDVTQKCETINAAYEKLDASIAALDGKTEGA